MNWTNYLEQFHQMLRRVQVTNNRGESISFDYSIKQFVDFLQSTRHTNNVVYFVGNGASAAMASHFSADIAKNGLIHTEVLTDVSLMSAMANDISYSDVFSEPLKVRFKKNDVLVSISSSGNSENVVRASHVAADKGGKLITLSAMSSANKLRRLGDLNFYLPADTYGFAESGHHTLLHHMVDILVGDFVTEEV